MKKTLDLLADIDLGLGLVGFIASFGFVILRVAAVRGLLPPCDEAIWRIGGIVLLIFSAVLVIGVLTFVILYTYNERHKNKGGNQ